MPLSWNEIKTRAISFSKEWENETSEDAEAKSFWDGFFDVFGMTRRRLASFEHEVEKRGGGKGYVDLFWPGMLLVEHKSRGKSLDKAHDQAFDYFPGIKEKDLPKYVLVSDFENLRLYDLEENKQWDFHLKDLHKKAHLFDFIAGYKKQEYKEEDEVNIKAAELMGRLYDSIAEAGYSGHDLNVLLVRVLFCLFADDSGIFNQGQFKRYIENRTSEDGSDLGMHLGMIFQVLNQSREKRPNILDEELNQFEYVNGGLFADPISISPFTSEMRLRLLQACAFDWSKISPAIFGSLFQSVMDKNARRHLGAHYTSEKNILKLIKPLFLDELKEELDACGKNNQRLSAFQEKLSKLKFLDPACGCGNFLVIAYRELRLLELEMLKRRFGEQTQLGLYDLKQYIHMRPEQFFGIEIEEFPAEIAKTAMWLMDHQMNELVGQTFGKNVPDLPLTKGATIFVGNALRKDWEEIVPKNELSYILGNPPFVGSKMMSIEQRNDILAVFDNAKGVGVLDYVSGWYIKATKYIQGTHIKCAFVSTNSITQGEQVGILWGLLLKKFGIKIHFAHKTFKWSNEARGKAAVFCVIIGFANFDADKKYLYEYESISGEPHEIKVKNINPYLVPADDLVLIKRSEPICDIPKVNYGSFALDDGNYTLSPNERDEIIINYPIAEKYIKPFIGGRELIHCEKRFCLWLEDANPEEIRAIKPIMDRIDLVREWRVNSKRKTTHELARTPMLFAEVRQPKTNYIAFPTVSSEKRLYIPVAFLSPDIIASNQLYIIPNSSPYHFGILTSGMHMAWVQYVCGRLKSDFRYSSSIVYNNFPWPENPNEEKVKAIESAAQEVLDVRAKYTDSSLADLYDPLTMPADLVKAHQNLDRAVDAAYGKRTFNSSAERMEFLFGLYEGYINKPKKDKL